jgi:hypothetical protein
MEQPPNAAAAFLKGAMDADSLIQAERTEAAFQRSFIDRQSDGIIEVLKQIGFKFSTEPYEPDAAFLRNECSTVSLVVVHPEAGHETPFRSFHLTFSTPGGLPQTFQIHAFQEILEMDIPDDDGGSWEGYLNDARGLSIYLEPLVMKIFPETAGAMLMTRLRNPDSQSLSTYPGPDVI